MAQHIRQDIAGLLDLIENDKPGVLEKVAKVENKIWMETNSKYVRTV